MSNIRTSTRYAVVLVVASVAFTAAVTSRATSQRASDNPAPNRQVRIGVFTLFHPRELVISSSGANALVVHAGDKQFVMEPSTGSASARVTFIPSGMLVSDGKQSTTVDHVLVTDRRGQPADFQLAVPGRIKRNYLGLLEIKRSDSSLVPTITMDLETAVASVVASETTSDMPMESLKAQAVAARSYFVASGGRHRGFDFCDTTHCQFLRDAPALTSKAARATAATTGLVLTFHSHPFPAMYTRSCSGHTLTPSQVHLPTDVYPYYSVVCRYCRAHPARWTNRISAADVASLHPNDEPGRLKLVRRLGWNTVPSNSFTATKQDGYIVVRGVGQGHGMGLCQAGATAMARNGADFRRILAHYFPNSAIDSLNPRGE